MLISRLLEEVWVFRGWNHHERRPWPRHQNDTVHSMLLVTIVSVCVPRKIMDYTVTWLEITTSTNISREVNEIGRIRDLGGGVWLSSDVTLQMCVGQCRGVPHLSVWKDYLRFLAVTTSLWHGLRCEILTFPNFFPIGSCIFLHGHGEGGGVYDTPSTTIWSFKSMHETCGDWSVQKPQGPQCK